MDLRKLKSHLESLNHGTMVLDAADAALQEPLQTFLGDLPAKSLRLVVDPATGILLSDTALIVTGRSPDSWKIPHPAGATVAIEQVILTIADSAGHALITLNSRGVLHLTPTVSIHVAITSPFTSEPWWSMAADRSGTENLRFDDIFLLGTASASPVDISAIEPLTGPVKVVRDSLLIRFLPSGIAPPISTATLRVSEGATWIIIPGLLELKGIDVMLFMGNASLGYRVVGLFTIGSTDLRAMFDIGPSRHWIAAVEPVIAGKWPGVADLAEFIGGKDLGNSIRDGVKSFEWDLNAFVLSKIIIGFDRLQRKLEYFDIVTSVAVKSIELDITLRLPQCEIRGGLKDEKALNIRDIVKRFGLEESAIPSELTISKLGFSAFPRVMSYSFEIAVNGIWSAGPFKLQEIELYIAYVGSDEGNAEMYGEISCSLSVGSAAFRLQAEHADRNSGWVFRGSMLEGSTISIQALIDTITKEFALPSIPDAVGDLKLTGLDLSYNTLNNAFDFICRGTFIIAGKSISATVTIAVSQKMVDNRKVYDLHTSGTFGIGTSNFAITFDATKGSKKIEVSWDDKTTPLSFADIAKHFEVDISGVPAEFLPALSGASFSYDFVQERMVLAAAAEHVRVVFISQPGENKGPRLFTVLTGLSVDVSLADLPLVGNDLASPDELSVSGVQAIVASDKIPATLAATLNSYIPNAPAGLPRFPAKGVDKGVMLAVTIKLAGKEQPPIAFQFGGKKKLASDITTTDIVPRENAPAVPAIAWISINRNIGPVHLKRIGVTFHDAKIWLLLDAGFALSGLSVALEELSLGFTLKAKPEFATGLNGLAITYHGGPVTIGGGLKSVTTKDGTEYDGTVIIQAENLNISAIGSYSSTSGHPSMFIFALLGADLGGPPYFHVTGLAAGFGYNRSLKIPTLGDLPKFPLVAAAMAGETGNNPFAGATDNASQALEVMRDYIAPAYGRHWLSAGVRFSSFKMINSFVLLNVAFGTSFEISLLGLSTMSVPTGAANPIGYAELALAAVFSPAKGLLAVNAQLTPRSYILSPECHLTGGFAFYTWFKDVPNEGKAGEFVVTLGGYHPHFDSGFYPKVPRLGAHWRVSNEMDIKGSLYFALTPSAVMAGGMLEATWASGDLKAWFTVEANFLLAWKPFHYEADIGLTIGASYTVDYIASTSTITVQVGVSLSLWGPPFAGRAYVDLYVISFTILFPDAREKKSSARPISWDEFKRSFLPEPAHAPRYGESDRPLAALSPADAYCTVTITSGMLRDTTREKKKDDDIDWVVHPESVGIAVRSVIPCTHAEMKKGSGSIDLTRDLTLGAFGVGPVDVPDGALLSKQVVTVDKIVDGRVDPKFDPTLYLDAVPIFDNVPRAAWSRDAALDPSISKMNSAPATIANALVGFSLTPRLRKPDHDPIAIDLRLLRREVESVQPSFAWSKPVIPTSDPFDQHTAMEKFVSTINSGGVSTVRNGILSALRAHNIDVGIGVDIDRLAESTPGTLMHAPQLKYLGEHGGSNE